MDSLSRSEVWTTSLEILIASLCLAGPVAGSWLPYGSPAWCAVSLLPAAVTLVCLGSQRWRVPAELPGHQED